MTIFDSIKTKRISAAIAVVMVLCCLTISVTAQKVNIESIPKEIQDQYSPVLQEKLFVHTDKTFYLPGELIWFKIYAIDGLLNKPSTFSKVAYVEILGADHKPILQTKIGLDNATGNGSLQIPLSVTTGNYTLRAYTQWMRNFGADHFFEQKISIINTLKESEFESPKKTKTFQIQFFPEGGNLVEGLSTKMAFKITDSHNAYVDAGGIIINQQKDTVVHFTSLHFGMGSFMFTPKTGEDYTVVLKLKDTIIQAAIPIALKQGYVMQLEDANAAELKISVATNSSNSNAAVYLIAQSHTLLKNVQANTLANGKTVFLIPKKDLADGISTFTVFNEEKQPVCERLYFKRPAAALNLVLTADQKQYGIRNKVNLTLAASDASSKFTNADLSMSVFQTNSFQTEQYRDIYSYLFLSSELKGTIDSPEYYFTNNDAAAADNLMLTQGWRKFNLKEKKAFFEFIPEMEGHLIKGKVSNKGNGSPAKNISTFLSIPGEHYQFANSTSDSSGSTIYSLHKFYGRNSIIAQTNRTIDSNYRIDMESPFSDQWNNTEKPVLQLSAEWNKELLQRSIAVQVENAYNPDEKRIYRSFKTTDSLAFYGIPDKKYFLDDYTRFRTMEEVMREYVSDVLVRQQTDHFSFKIWNTKFNTYFDDNPLVLIDGLPVFDINKIIAFDPLKVKKIEVVSKKYYLGSSINEGIISYSTYKGDLGSFELDPSSIVIEYEGLQKQREFYSPLYENDDQKKSRLPDFRNVLTWMPDIKTDAAGKTKLSFYTSDIKGRFIAIIQGITKDGLAGSTTLHFDVIDRP